MTKRVVPIRHGDDSPDDRVVSFFRAGNIEPEIKRPFEREELGPVDGSVAASVVYNGPFDIFGSPRARTREEQDRLMDEHGQAQHERFMGFLGRLFGGV